MKSKRLGKNISKVEINLTPNGVWLLLSSVEYFLPYREYPWFMEAKISEIYNVKLIHGSHLHWETLDIDLELDCLKNPEKYPLVYSQ